MNSSSLNLFFLSFLIRISERTQNTSFFVKKMFFIWIVHNKTENYLTKVKIQIVYEHFFLSVIEEEMKWENAKIKFFDQLVILQMNGKIWFK